MSTTKQWFCYFKNNLEMERINWNQPPGISQAEIKRILKSLQAWQLGETSDGKNLLKACSKYATKTGDLHYVKTMELFIKEEQKHGNNLGRYLDIIGQPRIKKDWGDSLFRKIRGFNTSMELWTLAVITIENAAQIFYQALKDATQCKLLKEICTDILIDEAPHIKFQQERFSEIFKMKRVFARNVSFCCYKYFYFSTSLVIWMAHKKLFKAGHVDFKKYCTKMHIKFEKTIGKLRFEINEEYIVSTGQHTA